MNLQNENGILKEQEQFEVSKNLIKNNMTAQTITVENDAVELSKNRIEIDSEGKLSENLIIANNENISISDTIMDIKKVSHNDILNQLKDELKPINFRERANLPEKEKLKKQHYVIMTIDETLAVAKKNKWSLCINHGQVYIYDGRFWKQLSKEELNNFLGKAAENLGVNTYDAKYHTYKADLSKQFISNSYLPRPEKKANEVLINLENGTFVITPDGYQLRNFDEKDFLTYQLPFKYDPDATAETFQMYLDKVLPDENQQDILAEYIGYIFIGQQTLKLEKSLILYGTGANGKSVFFIIIQALLGNENVSNFSLQALTNETGYQRAKLENKLVNYASEISPRMDSTIFKQLVSGEPVEARLPYGEPFILDNYAKLIFNTNELPKDVEQNDAFFRRFLILNFGVTIPEDERDPELAQKIISKELPGVFNWMLAGLTRLLKQKKFTKSEAVEEMVNQYRKQSDTVQLFLEEQYYEPSDTAEISIKRLYDPYKEYCKDGGYNPCSRRNFTERLRNLKYEFTRKNHGFVVKIRQKDVSKELH